MSTLERYAKKPKIMKEYDRLANKYLKLLKECKKTIRSMEQLDHKLAELGIENGDHEGNA